jgi:hypothetical protein
MEKKKFFEKMIEVHENGILSVFPEYLQKTSINRKKGDFFHENE